MIPLVLFALATILASSTLAAAAADESGSVACASAADTATQDGSTSIQALAECTRAIEQATLNVHDLAATLTNRGLLRNAAGQYQAARADFDQALALQPTLAEAWLGRGNSAVLDGELEAAVTDYSQVIRLAQPGTHLAYYNLGLVRARQGQLDLAAQALHKALQMEPEWPPALAALHELDSGITATP